MNPTAVLHRITIVGGGAGGLELATRLGDSLGRKGRAEITLIDRSRTHLWKPLLHEVAAGSMDLDDHELEYLAQARWHHFHYQLGALAGIDRKQKRVKLAPVFDDEGELIIEARTAPYDTLVIAIGSVSNHFGTPGVAEYCVSLDTQADAERFHKRLINNCIRAQAQHTPLAPGQLSVAIVGAGATGVELAAELHRTVRELAAFGLDRIDPARDIQISIIEAAPRILAQMPERLADSAMGLLHSLNVKVMTGEKVIRVTPEGLHTASGAFVPARQVVWAAGIKGSPILANLDGLEVARNNFLVVKQTLQTSRDDDIFALGDCAACPWPEKDALVPPRAQAAHQQASTLLKTLKRRLEGKPPLAYHYRDFGSLVSLGEYSTVGSLMGGLHRGTLMLEGAIAGFMYKSLYQMHLVALHGWTKAVLDAIARSITRRIEPHIKLH
jgi:NADH dehydrogenase